MATEVKPLVKVKDLVFEKYGVTVEAFVDESGMFRAELAGDTYKAETLVRLVDLLHVRLVSAERPVGFIRRDDGRAGVIRGVHKAQRVLLVTWDDGEKDKIDSYTAVLPSSAPAELVEEIRSAHAATVAAVVREREASRAARDLVVQAEILFAAHVGHNLVGGLAADADPDGVPS